MINNEEILGAGKLKVFPRATHLVSYRDSTGTQVFWLQLLFVPIALLPSPLQIQQRLPFSAFHCLKANYIENQVSISKNMSSFDFGSGYPRTQLAWLSDYALFS